MYHPIPSLSSITHVYPVFTFVSDMRLDSNHFVYLELASRAASALVAPISRTSCQADPLHLVIIFVVVLYQRSPTPSAVGGVDVGR